MKIPSPISRYVNSASSTFVLGLTFVATLSIIIFFDNYDLLVPVDLKNAYTFVLLFMIPVILVYLELSLNQTRYRGLLAMISSYRINWLTYFSSFLIILGYASLFLVVAYEFALYVQIGLYFFFDFYIGTHALTFVILFSFFSLYWVFKIYNLKSVWLYVLVTLALIIVFVISFITATKISEYNSIFMQSLNHIGRFRIPHYLLIITRLFGLLWVIDIVFIRWNSLSYIKSKFFRTSWPVILTLLGLSMVVGLVFADVLFNSGAMFRLSIEDLEKLYTTPAKYLDALFVSGYAVMMLTTMYLALDGGIFNFKQIINNVSTYFVYDNFTAFHKRVSKDTYSLGFMFLVITSLLLVTNFDIALNLVAVSFLLLTAGLMVPEILNKSVLSEDRWFKLPMTPIVPIIVFVISISLPINLGMHTLMITAFWLLGWTIYYLYNLRRHKIKRIMAQTFSPLSIDDNEFDILVPYKFGSDGKVLDLLRLGVDIAVAEKGQVILLAVDRRFPTDDESTSAKDMARLRKMLKDLIAKIEVEKRKYILPVVIEAESMEEGIQQVVSDYAIDLVLGEMNENSDDSLKAEEKFVEGFITENTYSLFGHYDIWDRRHMVIISHDYSNMDMIYDAVRRLLKVNRLKVTVLHVIKAHDHDKPVTSRELREAKSKYEKLFNSLNFKSFDVKVIPIGDLNKELKRFVAEAENKDKYTKIDKEVTNVVYPIFIYDVSNQQVFNNELSFARRVLDILIDIKEVPKLITNQSENISAYWLKSLWYSIIHPLPKATEAQKESVRMNMLKSARPSVDFYVMITLASVIATIGLIQSNVAIIIGAMLVAPLMSPILAASLNLVIGNMKHLLISIGSTIRGAIVAVLVAFLLAYLIPGDTLTSEILSRTEPSVLDLVVAIASGLAAVYAVVKKENAAALPGVAIAAALVPPLAVVGIGLGDGHFDVAWGATLLFLTNLIAITFFGAVMFMALGFSPKNNKTKRAVKRGVQFSVIALVIITVFLVTTTYRTVRVSVTSDKVEQILENELNKDGIYLQAIKVSNSPSEIDVDVQVVVFDDTVMKDKLVELEDDLSLIVKKPVKINATIVKGIKLY